MNKQPFFPYQALADTLLPFLPEDNGDGSHDLSHIHRVWTNAQVIQAKEGGDPEILLAPSCMTAWPSKRTHLCGLRRPPCRLTGQRRS